MMAEGTDTWDVIVIGGGPPGENAAQYAIEGSDRTAVIVESELLGGECSYWACMPSKALLTPVEVLSTARAMPGVASLVGDRPLDVPAVLARRDAFTHNHDDSSQIDWAQGTGIDVVRGHGRLAGPLAVEVVTGDGVRTLRARQAVVLAVGTSAAIPPVPGLAEALPWTSRDATNVHEIPRRIAVIGGGVVACEATTWLAALGVESVTVLQRSHALLGKNEPFAGQAIAEHFADLGVDVRFGAAVERVQRPDARDTGAGHVHGGAVTITVNGEQLVVDEILVAAGRHPRTDDIGLSTVGLTDGEYVRTDDHLAVSGVDGLYAVGDVTGRALLTHMGKYHGRICGAVIAARAEGRSVEDSRLRASADHDQVPQVTFTEPQVASVGLAESEARDRGIDVETVEYDLAALAGTSLLRDDYAGRAKLVIDRVRDVLVGATFVGPQVAELLHAATVAIVGQVSLDALWHAVPSYPTASEIWLRLLESRG